jgi:hypothetical protein
MDYTPRNVSGRAWGLACSDPAVAGRLVRPGCLKVDIADAVAVTSENNPPPTPKALVVEPKNDGAVPTEDARNVNQYQSGSNGWSIAKAYVALPLAVICNEASTTLSTGLNAALV